MAHFLKHISSWLLAVLAVSSLTLLAACDSEESPQQMDEQQERHIRPEQPSGQGDEDQDKQEEQTAPLQRGDDAQE